MRSQRLQIDTPPHHPLPEYYGDETLRRQWVRDIFDRTAADYERVESAMSAGSGARYRRLALLRAGLAPGMRVLDVGTGTGLVARQAAAIVGSTGSVLGVDPVIGMLQAGRSGMRLPVVAGLGERLPLASGAFDFLSMGYALRHVADMQAAFEEFVRVMRPGARLCILEITRPDGRFATGALKLYMRTVVPMVARVLASRAETPLLMRYYWDTIEACVPPATIMAGLQRAGFERVERHVEMGIFSEYRATRRQ
jgi:demethylmenaquinone methyltransferase/2-methoxy-6-polyprenyl-1,4-benzoquinol methylase